MGLKEDLQTFISRLRTCSGFSLELFSQLMEDTSDEVAFKMAARFHRTLGESLDFVKDGYAKGDSEPIWRGAHKVAGTAALLGFNELGANSKELVKKLRASSETPEEVQTKKNLLNDPSIRTEIEQYVKTAEAIHSSMGQACPNLDSYF